MRNVIPKDATLIPARAERVFKGVIFEVYQWSQKMFDGSYATFEMLKRPDTIKIIAIKNDKIVIVNEQQPHCPAFIDVPGGRHDVEKESELDAAKRELLEETGMSFKNWRLLSVHQRMPKIEQFVYVFLATGFAKQYPQKLDSGEKITVELVSFDELKALAGDPRARYLPTELLSKVNALEELSALPEYV